MKNKIAALCLLSSIAVLGSLLIAAPDKTRTDFVLFLMETIYQDGKSPRVTTDIGK